MPKHNQNDQTPLRYSDDLDEFAAAERELYELKKEQGLVKEGKISQLISTLLERRENRVKVRVNRKKHLLLAVFLGWMGAHRFYSKRYVLGILYLLFCWTGVPLAMTIIDLVEIIPIPPDEEGYIFV